jgi:hypothetical protein
MANNCINKSYKPFKPIFERYGDIIGESIIRKISREKGLPKGEFYSPSISEAKNFLKQVNDDKLEQTLRGLNANPYLSLEGIKDYLQGVITTFRGKMYIIKGNELGDSTTSVNRLEIFEPNLKIMKSLQEKYPDIFKLEYGSKPNTVTVNIIPRTKPLSSAKQLILFAESKGKGNKFSDYIPGKKSDSQTVLKQIAQTGGALAAIAKQLLKSGLNIPIEIIDVDSFNKDNLPEGVEGFDKSLDDNFQAAGLWSPTERKIFLAKGANVQNTAGILMHEILHGYTNLYIYNNPNSASVKNLDRLLKHLQTEKVQQMLTDKYPLTNLDELLVGIFTNPTFINDLKKLPPTNKNFKSVWEEILQIFRVIFGVTNTSLFDEVFAASSVIVDESMEQMIEQEEFVDTTYIKPGVAELFESNPELANSVYEALGFETVPVGWEKGKTLYDKAKPVKIDFKSGITTLPNGNYLVRAYRTDDTGLGSKGYGQRGEGLYLSLTNPYPGKNVNTVEFEISPSDIITYKEEFSGTIPYEKLTGGKGNFQDRVALAGGKAFIGGINSSEDPNLEIVLYDKTLINKALQSKKKVSNFTTKYLLYDLITPQQKQQAQQLYSQYLNSIFPDSKVKDIVYHGSIYSNKQKFKESTRVSGHYFATTPKEALQHAQRQLPNPEDANLYSILLNIKNPRVISKVIDYEDLDTEVKITIGDEIFGYNADGIIAERVEEYNTTYKRPETTWIEKQIVVFEPEQIHILGGKQDIEGFKKFVGKQNKVLAAPVSNVQKIVSDRLDSLQTKVIRNPQDNSVVIKDLENIQWIRPSEVAKSKIQKRQFGLKTVEQEEFEKLAQEAGTILHNIQANIIKETFPEYNKHVQKMVIDEGMLGFEQAIRKQLQPIINEAKSRGSILKAEVWIGNLKSQKGGTADLLEITPEGNYYVYDLKTRFTQDVSPLRRFNKINEWSDQTLEYNEILKAGDSELGVVQGKVLGTYILELEVEVKPENKFNYSGSTKYKATNAEKFLKRRELKNIKIVAPTFFLTGDKKIDAMINKLRSQIENMAKKTVSQEQRPAFNQTFESKLDLLQALQLKKDYNKFIQSGYIELAIIRKKLESNDLTDSAFIKEQLELYTNALGLLNPPQEVREQFKKIQGEAQELEIMFEELRKETVVDSANETDVIKRVGFADNLFAAVKDVSWVFSQTMGLADVDNPIVQTVFRKTTVALEKAREKVQQLGDRLMEVSNAYIKATGDKTYSKLIENGHLVDQWKPDFWKEFNAAKNQKNFDWAKDNVTFDEKSYIEARDKQLDFHDSITRDVYANKLKLENPDLDQNEIKRLVEAEIAAQMKKWEASYKNAFTYFTPKTKWTNPKYTEIINGPQKVKEMYLTLKNLLEYANEIIPERVKKNFIPNFQRDYIDKATQLGLLGSIKASWSGFFDSVEVTYDDEMMSQKDAITGEKLGRMWIPGITEIENKSLDLPVVFFKFMEGVYRYEELKSLEDLALTAKDILKKQQWLATDMLGNAISVDKTPSRPNPASRTLAMMEGWVDQVFYNKSLQKDVAVEIKGNGFTQLMGILKKGDKKMLSIGKMVDKVIHWTTLKNLGFSLYSPMVNLLGGSANMYMTGANGLYYSKSDLNKAMALALAGKTNLPNEDAKKARLILDWLNINAGEFIKKQEDLLSNSITKKLMADYNALALMRESENVLRDAGALAVVLGGKYEFNWDSFKVVDGKLVVEANDFQKSKFKQQIIKINRKNIGGISEDDMMLAKQQIVGRMLMQHRSWLPALFYERFGGKKYDWVLDKDIEGRYVTAFRLFKHLIGLSKITQLSEMEQANLKSTRMELALIIGIGILRSLLKSGLDDEDKKEAWYKISDKISDRVTGELVFFVDPTFESQYQILLSPAPVLGTAGDVGKFIGSLYKADDEDKRTKGPLQRAIKLTPLSKVDAFLTDLGLNPIDEK